MVKRNRKKLHTVDELKSHKKGKDYVAERLAEQEVLENYKKLSVEPVPSHLDYYGKKEWKRIAPLLKELPVAELDRELIETYCMLHAARRRLEKNIQENGISYTVEDREGNEVVRKNPSYDMLLATVREIRMIASQLGMTMSSRLDLAIPNEETKEDEVMKLLRGG